MGNILNQFDISKPMIAAQQYNANALALDGAESKVADENAMRRFRGDALSGDKEAIKKIGVINPQSAAATMQILDGIKTMDDRGKELAWKNAEQMMGFAAYADTPEKWNEGKRALKDIGLNMDIIGEFDENKRAVIVGFANKIKEATQAGGGEKLGQPTNVLDSSTNKNTLVRFGDRGSVLPVQNYAPAPKEESNKDYKAGDANSIRGGVAGIFGGRYDPMSDTFIGLSKDVTSKVTAIAAKAEEIFIKSRGGLGHNQAVQQAAREFGISLPAPANLSAAPQGASNPQNDRLSIRRWLADQ